MVVAWRRYPAPIQQTLAEGRIRTRFATAGGEIAEAETTAFEGLLTKVARLLR